ncbi:MAG: hypothetical protein KDE25_02165 [Novosphingobium sp.]|nr:hypothetical protein [Novosphingobium sp.]
MRKAKRAVVWLIAIVLVGASVLAWRFFYPGIDAQLSRLDGALVSGGAETRIAGASANVDCKTASLDLCDNFANTDIVYRGFLTPCKEGRCPFDKRQTVLADGEVSFQLDPNEAMVFLVDLPDPPHSFLSLQVTLYERSRARIPNPQGYVPPAPGETLPPPRAPDRRVVDAAIGDTRNTRLARSDGEDLVAQKGRILLVVTPNRVAARQIEDAARSVGIDPRAVLVYGLPEGLHYSSGSQGDSFRAVLRFGRPFDESLMAKLPRLKLRTVMRVSFPDNIAFEGFAPEARKRQAVGRDELSGPARQSLEQLEQTLLRRFGPPAQILPARVRRYDDAQCRDTGSYCWGNNNETLYANFSKAEDGRNALLDLSEPGSRLIVVGVDHHALGFADFWNIGFFARDGKVLQSLIFSDLANGRLAELPDDGLFWFQLRARCAPGDLNCIALPADTGPAAAAVSAITRIYINPQTGVAPDVAEIVLPKAYYFAD